MTDTQTPKPTFEALLNAPDVDELLRKVVPFNLVTRGKDEAWLLCRSFPGNHVGAGSIRLDGDFAKDTIRRFAMSNEAANALLAHVAAKDALIQNLCALLDASPTDEVIRNNRAERADAALAVARKAALDDAAFILDGSYDHAASQIRNLAAAPKPGETP